MKIKFLFSLLLILCLVLFGCATSLADDRFDYVWAYYNGAAQFEKDGKIGLLDAEGNILTQAEYDSIDVRSVNNLRAVKKDGLVGMLNETGALWQGRLFQELFWFSEENGLLIFEEEINRHNYAGMLNVTGEIIHPATWHDYKIEMYEINYYGESIPDLPIFLVIHDDQKGIGVMNTRGEWILPYMRGDLQFDYYENGRLRMMSREEEFYSFGVVDEMGIIIEPVWDNIVMPRESDLFPVCRDKKWGFVDLTGEVLIPLAWASAYDFIDGYAPVQAEDGKWGFMNTKGELTVPTIYEEVNRWGYSNGYANVMDDTKKWGVIDMEGNTIVSFLWDDIHYDPQANAIVKKDGKYGFIHSEKEIVLPLPYDGAWYITENIYCMSKDGAWGYVDKNDVPLTTFEFQEERWFLFSVAEEILDWLPCIYLDKSQGCEYINLKGEVMLEGDWDSAEPFYGKYARVRDDGDESYHWQYGVIDREGKVVIPIEYDNVYWEEDNLFQVDKDGVKGWIGPDFKIIAGIKE